MELKDSTKEWLEKVRRDAEHESTLIVIVSVNGHRFAVFPEDIRSKDDVELFTHILEVYKKCQDA